MMIAYRKSCVLVKLLSLLPVVCVCLARPAFSSEIRITFFSQDGAIPTSIEIDNGADYATAFDFEPNSAQSTTIGYQDFRSAIETFFVTVNYEGALVQSFELRMLRPSSDAALQEKRVFLSQPEQFSGGNYVAAVAQNLRLLRRDRRKAFVPFFQCRESYFRALGLGDKQTAIQALECWVQSNHRLVFADPRATRRLVAPDSEIAGEFADLIENISVSDKGWLAGLEASGLRQRDLERLAIQIREMELSDWLFYEPLQSRADTNPTEDVCARLSQYQNELAELSRAEVELLSTGRFGIDFPDNQQLDLVANTADNCRSAISL